VNPIFILSIRFDLPSLTYIYMRVYMYIPIPIFGCLSVCLSAGGVGRSASFRFALAMFVFCLLAKVR
jgi:hypothetical protein